MEEDKIHDLFDKYQDQWNEWDGNSVGYTNFKKAIKEALMLHSVSGCYCDDCERVLTGNGGDELHLCMQCANNR